MQQGKVVNEELKHNMSEKLRAAADSIENAGKKAADAASDVIENAAGKSRRPAGQGGRYDGRGARRAEGKNCRSWTSRTTQRRTKNKPMAELRKSAAEKESPAAEKRAAGCMRL